MAFVLTLSKHFQVSLGLLMGLVSTSHQVSAEDYSAFLTPSGNIACIAFADFLRCDLKQNLARIPRQPQDCELDWGNYFGMGLKGKPQYLCVGDTAFGKYPVLAYGKAWQFRDFVCKSEKSGLTCSNKDQHGWKLNKLKQKFF